MQGECSNQNKDLKKALSPQKDRCGTAEEEQGRGEMDQKEDVKKIKKQLKKQKELQMFKNS